MMNNFKSFFSKLMAVVVCSSLVAGATPIAGVFADEVSSDVIPVVVEEPATEEPATEEPVAEVPVIEEPAAEDPVVETPVVETPVEEIPAVEEPVAEEPVIEASANIIVSDNSVSVSEDAATAAIENFCEPITEYPELMAIDSDTDGEMSKIASTTTQYFYQPSWYPNTAKGYDAIVAYLTDEKGEYVARCFFVTDGSEWLLYDYGETAATEFFAQTELKDGKYIPVQKGKSRSDNVKTVGIDESKIPTITEKEFYAMVFDWRQLSNIPFTRDANGNLVYAGKTTENPDPKPSPSSNDLLSYKFTINSTSYEVRVNKEVPYTGRRHVGKWAKNNAKQINDLDIQLYRNNEFVDHSYYSVKYYNNLNVTGYGKETIVPFFVITLKNEFPFKADRKAMASKKFGFNIVPVDISTVNFKAKKVRVATTANGVKVSLNTPTAKINDVTIKLSPVSTKNPRTGSYTVSYVGGNVVVYGANNFTGSTTLNLSAAKTMDYVF